MLLGLALTVLALLSLWRQLKKNHEDRNVVLLFFSFAIGLVGLWMVFDWIIMKTWL